MGLSKGSILSACPPANGNQFCAQSLWKALLCNPGCTAFVLQTSAVLQNWQGCFGCRWLWGLSEQGKACRERQNLLLIEKIWLGKEEKKKKRSLSLLYTAGWLLGQGYPSSGALGDGQVTTADTLGEVSAGLLSIASSLLFLRMFFLKSLFHFSLKNGWKIRFYWWKNCTWGFAFTHVFYGNKSAATWLLFLVVLILFGLVTQC